MEMTYRHAMTIQTAQSQWYRRSIGYHGIKAIRKATLPCPGNPDVPMSIIEINELVPRGACFERYITHWPETHDDTATAVHDAITRGLPY